MKVFTTEEFQKLSEQEKTILHKELEQLPEQEYWKYRKKVITKEVALGQETRAEAIRNEHFLYESSIKQGLAHAVRAGELLLEVKAKIPHGEFSEWILNNCYFSQRTAQNYMRFYTKRKILAKAQETAGLTDGEMTMEQALQLLKNMNVRKKEITQAITQADNKLYKKTAEEKRRDRFKKSINFHLEKLSIYELEVLNEFLEAKGLNCTEELADKFMEVFL